MPHVFGQDVHADDRWLAFLQSDRLTHSDRRVLLASGFDPDKPDALPDTLPLSDGGSEQLEVVSRTLMQPPRSAVNWAVMDAPVRLVHLGESAYSALLAECNDAPPALFVVGDVELLNRPAIAIVGARRPSADGQRAARELAGPLAGSGLVVISGLARGIDGVAHRAALSAGSKTIAVMATGIDRIYPSEHRELARQIAASGALVTEFCPGARPERWHFPRRNRTISGLSLATVVVEAAKPSGSLITAHAAVEQGRDVFAYPWSIYHNGGAGCRQLLLEGAQIACGPIDVLTGVGPALDGQIDLSPAPSQKPQVENVTPLLGNTAASLLQHIGDGEQSINQLLDLTGLDAAELRALLSQLELAGRVVPTPTGYRASRLG